MHLRHAFILLAFAWLPSAHAQDDDPALLAAQARCPGAKAFMQAHPQTPPPPAATDAPIALPALREELLAMRDRDQQARSGGWSQEEMQRMQAVDAGHLPRIKAIVAEHGVPTRAQVGADGVDAAWLLVQHADADPAFQEQVLAAIAGREDVSRHQFVLLTDRVLAGQGKPQRYGSQLQAQDGRWVPKPIEAPAGDVDQRRAAMGDMPLADYLCMATQMFPPPAP